MSSKAREGKDPPRKRQKKKPSPTTEPVSILSLPDDLLLSCLACVSRLYHPTLSLVCKKFRSIISSLEFYNIRSLLNRTESCLYLSLHAFTEPDVHWFTLCRKPNEDVTNKSSGYCLVPIPSAKTLYERMSTSVSVSSNIYIIGGDEPPSSSSSVLDCRTHKWHKAPSMRVDRSYYTASVVAGKIYVAGRSKGDNHSLVWVEVFDPKTQTWCSMTNPGINKNKNKKLTLIRSLELEGKLYLFGDKYFVFNPKEGRWTPIETDGDMRASVSFSYCVIDDIILFFCEGVFLWYDHKCKERSWKTLHGLEELPYICAGSYCKLVNLGGKMVVLWESFECSYDLGFQKTKTMIWCAEIELERRNGNELWGNVEWFDVVLTVPEPHRLLGGNALSVTL